MWLEGVRKEEGSEVIRALGGSSHALKAPGGIYDKDREVLRGSGERQCHLSQVCGRLTLPDVWKTDSFRHKSEARKVSRSFYSRSGER